MAWRRLLAPLVFAGLAALAVAATVYGVTLSYSSTVAPSVRYSGAAVPGTPLAEVPVVGYSGAARPGEPLPVAPLAGYSGAARPGEPLRQSVLARYEGFASDGFVYRFVVWDRATGYPVAFPLRPAVHCFEAITSGRWVYAEPPGRNYTSVDELVTGCFEWTWEWDANATVVFTSVNGTLAKRVPLYQETRIERVSVISTITGVTVYVEVVFAGYPDVPAYGELVRVYANGSLVGEARADERGRASVSGLVPPGTYVFTVDPAHGPARNITLTVSVPGAYATWTPPEFKPVAPSYTTVPGILMVFLWLAMAIILSQQLGTWLGIALTSFLISVYGVLADIPVMVSAGLAGIVAALIIRRIRG